MGKPLARESLDLLGLSEKADGSDFEDRFDPNEIADVFGDLEKVGVRDWVKKQIEMFTASHFSNNFAREAESFRGFLQGTVFGFVWAKSGDRELASKAGKVALWLALHNNVEVP